MVLGLSVALVVAQDRAPVRTVKDGILDEVRLYAEKLPAGTKVAIRPFSATTADLTEGDKEKDETKKMQADGLTILADEFVTQMKELGPFAEDIAKFMSARANGKDLK